MSVERFFVHAATSTRAVKARTPGGGTTTTWVAVLTGEPCAIRPVSSVEREKGGSELAEATDWLYVSGGADVQRDDVFSVAGTDVTGAQVRFVENPGYLDRYLRVALKVERHGR